jgi:hypothetical protein
MKKITVFLAFTLLAAGVAAGADTRIRGDYLEVRTANVFVGPCIANGEVNLTGKEAILAWRVSEGSWDGTAIEGLSVVAVVRGEATLGDPFAGETEPARSLIVVDQAASEPQKKALVSLAHSMAPELLDRVVSVESAPIDLSVDSQQRAVLEAGDIASFSTRGFRKDDHFCGNETVLYPPLVQVDAEPAFTLEHEFRGDGLGSRWSSPHRASAFVGQFAR